MRMYTCCYWRFKGGKAYRFGYPHYIHGTMTVRMRLWRGDISHGTVVDVHDIEIKKFAK
jgi:hypothetical protein